MDLAEDIRERYMELKELSLDDEIGRGFMNATERLRAAREPELANQLLKQSEAINTENLIGAVKQWAESEPDWENLESQEWYAQMTGMDKYRFLGAFMGTQGNSQLGINPQVGLKALMTQTHKGALQFQQLFNVMSEKYQLEGKPLKEYSGFDAMQASISDAVEATAVKESTEEANLLKEAQSKALPLLFEMATQTDPSDRSALTSNFIQAGDAVNPEKLRERITKRTGIDTKGLTDEQVLPFAGWVLETVHGIGDTHNKQTAALLTKALGKNYERYDERPGLKIAFLNAKRLVDKIPGTRNVSAFYSTMLNGYGAENEYDGLAEQGGGYMVNVFDDLSGGAVTQYTKDLNDLKNVVEGMLPENATDEQFVELYRTKHEELQENFEGTIASVVAEHVDERTNVLRILDGKVEGVSKALIDVSKEEGYEGLEGAVFLVPKLYAKTIRDNPTMSPQEAMSLAKDQGKFLPSPSSEILRHARGNNSEEADRIIKGREVSLQKYSNLSKSFNEGENFYLIQDLATSLADEGIPWVWKDNVKQYQELMGKASETEQGRIKYGIDTKEVASISDAVVAKPKAATVLRDGDDFIRTWFKRKDGRMKGFTPWNYVDKNDKGELITDPDWVYKIKRNVTLPPGFLQKNQPPITGIPFGKYTPITSDVEDLRKKIGWSPEQLKNTVTAYGFSSASAFFRSQYNNAYYYNLRASKAK
jgi:hypothetical protein